MSAISSIFKHEILFSAWLFAFLGLYLMQSEKPFESVQFLVEVTPRYFNLVHFIEHLSSRGLRTSKRWWLIEDKILLHSMSLPPGLVHYTVGKSPHIISPILPPLIARGLMETIGNILFISSHIPVHLAPACTVFISRLTRYSIHVYCVFYQDLPFKLRFEKKMFVLYLFCANQVCKNAILFDNCKEINEKMCWLFGSSAVLCLFVNFLWNSLWFHLVDKILRVLLVFLKLY